MSVAPDCKWTSVVQLWNCETENYFGNLILNWPKLLRPFDGFLKPFFHVISMCMYSQCDSTSLPVQRSQIELL